MHSGRNAYVFIKLKGRDQLHSLDLDWKKVFNSALSFCWNVISVLGSMNGGNFWTSQANTNSQELFCVLLSKNIILFSKSVTGKQLSFIHCC